MNCPVLFIVFNRVETSQSVFSEIRKFKPKKLFISADGPRSSHEFEIEKCLEVRRLVTQIDWDCELYTLFREVNVGCGSAVSSAINWFFKHVDEGIILEDDCLPSDQFFKFCSLALEKYRHRDDVMHIGGVSYHSERDSKFYDYRFSRYGHIWGWATWKRAWIHYDLKITDCDEEIKRNVTKLNSRIQESYWMDIFIKQRDLPIDTWDYSWQYIIWKMDGYCIYPKFSMVENIGFDAMATHTKSHPRLLPTRNLKKLQILTFVNFRLFNFRFINRYYDYINFMRAFKTKDVDATTIKSLIKYLIYRRV
jgi:hypothetical protein